MGPWAPAASAVMSAAQTVQVVFQRALTWGTVRNASLLEFESKLELRSEELCIAAGESAITMAGRKHFSLEHLWSDAKTPCVLAAVIVAGYVCTVGLPDLAVFAQLTQSPASAIHARHTHITFI